MQLKDYEPVDKYTNVDFPDNPSLEVLQVRIQALFVYLTCRLFLKFN